MIRRINRINDYAFKRIFGSPENKDVLLHFINSILAPDGKDELIEITLLDREIDPQFIFDKSARLDILGRTPKGDLINIEVQVNNEGDIEARALFYWSRLLHGQLRAGQFYRDLKPAVSINVLNFSFLPDREKYHNVFNLRERASNVSLSGLLDIHFLEYAQDEEFAPSA